MSADRTTEMMLEEWVKHQATKPTAPEDYLANVDHLRRRMDAWQATEDSWRLLVGVRLANAALRERMGGEGR